MGPVFFWNDFRCLLVPSNLGMLNFDSSGDGMLESVRPWPLVMAWKFCALAAAPDMVCIDQLLGPGFVPVLCDTFYVLIRIDTYWTSSLFGTILDPSQHDWDLVWGPLYRSSRGGGILALEIAEIYRDRWRLDPGPILELQRGIIGHHVSHHLTAHIHIL